jgi:hypothetical protein
VPTTETNKQSLYSCIGLGAVRFKSIKRINFTKFQITSPPPPLPPFGPAGLGVDGQQGGDHEGPVDAGQEEVHVC